MRVEGFVNAVDCAYLKSYAIEHFSDLLEREKLNRFDNLFNQGDEFDIKLGTRKHRAMVID